MNNEKEKPATPEIPKTPTQPGKDKPEIQQPSKDLPQKESHPDEIQYPTKKPDIQQPQQ